MGPKCHLWTRIKTKMVIQNTGLFTDNILQVMNQDFLKKTWQILGLQQGM